MKRSTGDENEVVFVEIDSVVPQWFLGDAFGGSTLAKTHVVDFAAGVAFAHARVVGYAYSNVSIYFFRASKIDCIKDIVLGMVDQQTPKANLVGGQLRFGYVEVSAERCQVFRIDVSFQIHLIIGYARHKTITTCQN